MHKVLYLLLFIFLLSSTTYAQNKYAVIVGINDYFDAPGVKNPKSLHGCVNDALSIKELLVDRFGFAASNITLVKDAEATKMNVINKMHMALQRCNAGDAFVFYFSGHGAWMSNYMNTNDLVKRGMSQAMVMSNLYAPELDCLFTDEMVKQVFDEFVDKKVIVTSIFDCCYSGNISMMMPPGYWIPMHPKDDKSLFLQYLPYIQDTARPGGCPVDSLGHITDSTDTDHDGVPDCKDWEINTIPGSEVDSLGVRIYFISAENYIASLVDNSNAQNATNAFTPQSIKMQSGTRSFNLKDALTTWAPSISQRPSERKNSGFISLSAATDRELGAEVGDESGIKHGAFTKALLTVYNENPADFPVADLLKKLSDMMDQQYYDQHPTYHYEAGRLQGNLVGIKSTNLSDKITATCISNKNGVIVLDKGYYANIGKGNVFADVAGHDKVKITYVYADSAIGIGTAAIRSGHKLATVDRYTVSPPLVKIFISSAAFTPAEFDAFINSKILPLTKESNYGDYHHFQPDAASSLTLFDDSKKFHTLLLPGISNEVINYVFLPLPSYIANELNKKLSKDQNIQIVSKEKDADYILYLHFANDPKTPGFAFYFHPPMAAGYPVFSRDVFQTPTLNISGKDLASVTQKLYDLTRRTIRFKTTNWINTYTKK